MDQNKKIFRGTSLSEDDFTNHNILHRHDQLQGEFAWDTGIAIGNYLSGLKNGKIIGATCHNCKITIVPPRLFCEWCFKPIDHFLPLQDTGIVNTFSICYVTWDVKRIKEPELPAVIEIDGASPLHGILHMLGAVKPEEVIIGMKVRAKWKPADERIGAITDILYFEPY